MNILEAYGFAAIIVGIAAVVITIVIWGFSRMLKRPHGATDVGKPFKTNHFRHL